jgi:hypothetical protein
MAYFYSALFNQTILKPTLTMRKTRVLFFLFVLFGTGLFAQSDNKPTPPVGNDSFLQVIAPLNEQAAKVNAAYNEVLAASTGSRAVAAAAQTKLNDACNVYLAELNKVAAANPYASALQQSVFNEKAAVNKIQSQYCPTGK